MGLCSGMSKILACLVACSSFASAAIVEKTVIYEQGGKKLEGCHVYDDAVTGKRPAVLVIHQWTGLTNYEKERSRMLAKLGYNVFAADIYGQCVRPVPPAAGQEAGKYKADRKLYRARLMAALDQFNPHFPALRSVPMAVSEGSRHKQIPSNDGFVSEEELKALRKQN